MLYPLFVVWGITGTFWYAEMKVQEDCFVTEQVSWYFAMWLIVVYSWIVGYTAYISYATILYVKHAELERQYVLLVDQYEGVEVPELVRGTQGLSPQEISLLTIEEVPEEGENVCSVCLDRLYKGDKVRIMPCFHKFHMPCIDKWLMQKRACPNCLRRICVGNQNN